MDGRNGTSRMLLLLYCLLIVALLVLTASGAKLYGAAVSASQAHAHRRSALAYIQGQTASCQGAEGAYLKDGPEGKMLCLPEPDGKYETRIYLWENTLRSELVSVEGASNPENSEVICALSAFEVCWQQENLLRITADGQPAFAAVQGGGGNG